MNPFYHWGVQNFGGRGCNDQFATGYQRCYVVCFDRPVHSFCVAKWPRERKGPRGVRY